MATFQEYIVLIGENKIKVTVEKDAIEEDRKLIDNLKEIQAWWIDNNGPGEPPELDEENSGLLYFSNSSGLPIELHIGEAIELQYYLTAEANKKLIK